MATKHILTFQSKLLLDHFEFNELYMCKSTRENKHKYKKMQESMGLSSEYYPIWLYQPSDIEYVVKGSLFRNENFISAIDLENFIMTELLFHISVSGTDYTKLRNLSKHYYLYEFVIDTDDIYADVLEGYGICGATTHLWIDNVVNAYEFVIPDTKAEYTQTYTAQLVPRLVNNTSMLTEEVTVPLLDTCDNLAYNLLAEEMYNFQWQNFELHQPIRSKPNLEDVDAIDFSIFDENTVVQLRD